MKEILMAGLIFILGLWLTCIAFGEHRDYAKLDTQGIDVMSEPLDGYTKHTKAGVTTGYSIYPKFQTQNGESHSCSGNVDQEIVDHLQALPIIKVRYLSIDPSICRVDGADTKGVWFIMLIGIGMVLGSAAYIYNRSSLKH